MDFVKKLMDFKQSKENYPNPTEFKNKIIEPTANKINNRISKNN